MTNQLQQVTKGALPLSSDINQLIGTTQGTVSPGPIQLAAPLSAPSTAPTAATNGTGSLTGSYGYVYTNMDGVPLDNGVVNINGETTASPVSASVTASSNAILVSNLAFASAPGVGGRIYRNNSTGSASTGPFYLVTTITDPSQTTFADDVSDASLGAELPTSNTTGTPCTVGSVVTLESLLYVLGQNLYVQGNIPQFIARQSSSPSSTSPEFHFEMGRNSDTEGNIVSFDGSTVATYLKFVYPGSGDSNGSIETPGNTIADGGILQAGSTSSGTYAQYNDTGELSLDGGTFYAIPQIMAAGRGIQSGQNFINNVTTVSVTFPVAYASTPIVVASMVNTTQAVSVSSISTTGFTATLTNAPSNAYVSWVSLG